MQREDEVGRFGGLSNGSYDERADEYRSGFVSRTGKNS